MNVTLPDSLRNWIETQATMTGHSSADGYVETVLRAEQTRLHREIDSKLLAGLASGEPIEVNEAFWAERRRVLQERLANHKKESA